MFPWPAAMAPVAERWLELEGGREKDEGWALAVCWVRGAAGVYKERSANGTARGNVADRPLLVAGASAGKACRVHVFLRSQARARALQEGYDLRAHIVRKTQGVSPDPPD